VSPTIPVVEARPAQEQAIEDSIVESSSRVFSAPIEVSESARERREQEQLWDEQLRRRAAALKQAEEENRRKLEAQKRLREQFKALVELERQKRAEELEMERAMRERDERLDARVGDSLSALQVPAVSGKGREELPGEELLTLRGQFMTLEQRLDLAEKALRTSDEAAFVRAQKRESEGRLRSREAGAGVHAGDTATQTGGPFGAAMYRVTVARAVCRSGPSAGADSVALAGRADRVYADRIENDWIRVTIRGDTHAWLRRDQCVPESELDHRQIERLESLAGRELNRWIVTADSVSLRDARLGGKELRTLFAGDLLLLNSSQAGMLRVTTERRKVAGFIPSVSAAQYSSLSASQVATLKATGQKLRENAQMAMALKYRSRETIQDSIGRHIPNINVLYKKKLKMYPNMEGTVWITFRVDPSGRVISAKVKSSDITEKDFIDPFLAYTQRIHFKSVPQEVGDMSFVFPFEFSLK
jgi:TonB family protein